MYKQGYVVSRQTFALLLKELENLGLVSRTVLDTHPPRVNYRLTARGDKIRLNLISITEELTKK
jgi:DNA-binding HxlR family transcriptional regulator